MVYVIECCEPEKGVMLVKCENEQQLKQRLNVGDIARVLGVFTDQEIEFLDKAKFAVFSA